MNRDWRPSQAYGPALPAQFIAQFSDNHLTFFKLKSEDTKTTEIFKRALHLVPLKRCSTQIYLHLWRLWRFVPWATIKLNQNTSI